MSLHHGLPMCAREKEAGKAKWAADRRKRAEDQQQEQWLSEGMGEEGEREEGEPSDSDAIECQCSRDPDIWGRALVCLLRL